MKLSFLEELAVESGVIDDVSEDSDLTIGDVIEHDQQTQQPLDVLAEVEQSESVAGDLEELADRADGLVSDEEELVSNEAIKTLTNEYRTLARIHRLEYHPESFESVGTSSKAEALAKDVRYAARHLRSNADALSDISNESRLLDLFKSKDTRIKEATRILGRDIDDLKRVAGELNQTGVELKHNGLAMFMSANLEPIKDLNKQIDVDISYIEKWSAYVGKMMKELEGTKTEDDIKEPNEKDITTFKGFETGMLTRQDAERKENFPLFGNHGFGMFIRWDGTDPSKILTMADRLKAAFAATVYGGATIAAASTIAGPFSAGLVGGMVVGITVGLMSDKYANRTGENHNLSVKDLESAINKTIKLAKLADTSSVYTKLDSLLKENKDLSEKVLNHRKKLGNIIKAILDAIKTHIFYIVTNISTLVNLTVKRVKAGV